ncbi:cell division protein FtsH [Platysternon megacephalum]|uniref:Cell division protein FtsH n=1 Tax=Platysternon megacephalum TaxID=55544 RepID=A0A4D9DL41_9SAUR|nr:cell division protein FtsH [Platysternon megacephalum]
MALETLFFGQPQARTTCVAVKACVLQVGGLGLGSHTSISHTYCLSHLLANHTLLYIPSEGRIWIPNSPCKKQIDPSPKRLCCHASLRHTSGDEQCFFNPQLYISP